MNRYTLEAKWYDGEKCLFLYDGRYHIPIFKLAYNETSFMGGRFIRYREEMTFDNTVTFQDYANFTDDDIFENIINWVAENIDGCWNVKLRTKQSCFFNFENVDDAVHFKLKWI